MDNLANTVVGQDPKLASILERWKVKSESLIKVDEAAEPVQLQGIVLEAKPSSILKRVQVHLLASRRNVLTPLQALYPYEPSGEGEIRLREGDIISVTKEYEDGEYVWSSHRLTDAITMCVCVCV